MSSKISETLALPQSESALMKALNLESELLNFELHPSYDKIVSRLELIDKKTREDISQMMSSNRSPTRTPSNELNSST